MILDIDRQIGSNYTISGISDHHRRIYSVSSENKKGVLECISQSSFDPAPCWARSGSRRSPSGPGPSGVQTVKNYRLERLEFQTRLERLVWSKDNYNRPVAIQINPIRYFLKSGDNRGDPRSPERPASSGHPGSPRSPSRP